VLGELAGHSLEADDREGSGAGRADLLQVAVDGVLAGLVAVLGAETTEQFGPLDLGVVSQQLLNLLAQSQVQFRGPTGAPSFPKWGRIHLSRNLLVNDAPLGAGRDAGEPLDAVGVEPRLASAANESADGRGMHR
jgi:hypothetical protein